MSIDGIIEAKQPAACPECGSENDHTHSEAEQEPRNIEPEVEDEENNPESVPVLKQMEPEKAD